MVVHEADLNAAVVNEAEEFPAVVDVQEGEEEEVQVEAEAPW